MLDKDPPLGTVEVVGGGAANTYSTYDIDGPTGVHVGDGQVLAGKNPLVGPAADTDPRGRARLYGAFNLARTIRAKSPPPAPHSPGHSHAADPSLRGRVASDSGVTDHAPLHRRR